MTVTKRSDEVEVKLLTPGESNFVEEPDSIFCNVGLSSIFQQFELFAVHRIQKIVSINNNLNLATFFIFLASNNTHRCSQTQLASRGSSYPRGTTQFPYVRLYTLSFS